MCACIADVHTLLVLSAKDIVCYYTRIKTGLHLELKQLANIDRAMTVQSALNRWAYADRKIPHAWQRPDSFSADNLRTGMFSALE